MATPNSLCAIDVLLGRIPTVRTAKGFKKGKGSAQKGTADEWQGHYPKGLETREILMLTDPIDGPMVHDASENCGYV